MWPRICFSEYRHRPPPRGQLFLRCRCNYIVNGLDLKHLMHLSHANSVGSWRARHVYNCFLQKGEQMIMAFDWTRLNGRRRPNWPSDNSQSFFHGSNIGGGDRGRMWGDRMHTALAQGSETCFRFSNGISGNVVVRVCFIVQNYVCVSGCWKLLVPPTTLRAVGSLCIYRYTNHRFWLMAMCDNSESVILSVGCRTWGSWGICPLTGTT